MRGDGRIYVRGKTYWIAYYAPGADGRMYQVRESSKSARLSVAKQLLKKRLREVGNDRAGIKKFQ
ncbi:MAG TPA: hypothetical protein VKU62_08745, partial [Thermoanaerobaculia bacterium]|nr:hypothetical protein [Thermoanaerobaculia bacterium]